MIVIILASLFYLLTCKIPTYRPTIPTGKVTIIAYRINNSGSQVSVYALYVSVEL